MVNTWIHTLVLHVTSTGLTTTLFMFTNALLGIKGPNSPIGNSESEGIFAIQCGILQIVKAMFH